jgi:hypothetical protein
LGASDIDPFWDADSQAFLASANPSRRPPLFPPNAYRYPAAVHARSTPTALYWRLARRRVGAIAAEGSECHTGRLRPGRRLCGGGAGYAASRVAAGQFVENGHPDVTNSPSSIAVACRISTLTGPSGRPRFGTTRKDDPKADRRTLGIGFDAAGDFPAARNGCIAKGELMLSTEAANGVG